MSSLGRTTRAYVSGYQRTRLVESELDLGEVRALVANFRGAVRPNVTITTAAWYCNLYNTVVMSNAAIDAGAKETQVNIKGNYGGTAAVKCVATMSDGTQMTQQFLVTFYNTPWYTNYPYTYTAGPASLVVNA